MWKLTIEDDQGNKTVVNLVREEYSVGRAEDNTVRLTERNISRHHARITKQDSGWVIEDLASYNGCYVNGMRVGQPQHLEHGDLVQVGDYRLEVIDEAVAQQALPDVGTGSRPSTVPGVPRGHSLLGQPDRLVMLVGPAPGSEYPLVGERVVIGRGEECDVSINHGSVSRVHAEIRNLGNGRYELLDRGSANGLRINGVELERSLIDARDTIELGDVVLKYIPAGQIYRPGADESQQIGAVAAFMPEHFASTPGIEAHPKPGLSPGVKVVAAVGGLGALMILGMVIVGTTRHSAAPSPAVTAAAGQQVDSAAATLAAAKALLDQGQIEAAHAKALTIPEDSNARQSADFREIEARWADLLLDRANQENDPAKKRALLNQVASTTSVDSVRRKRAASEIALLDNGEGVDINQLPSAPHPKTTAEPVATEKVASSGLVRTNPFDAPPKKKKKKTTSHATHSASTAHTTSKAKEPSGATSGDRSQQTAVKNALKAKVASGKGTDQDKRLLRALCRQLGDMSCVN